MTHTFSLRCLVLAGLLGTLPLLVRTQNVGIGTPAPTQSLDVLVGYQAGLNNTASGNHFVGFQAGMANTTTTNNHFAGYQADQNTTTGPENTFVGAEAGQSNVTSSANVALGFRAGRALNDGTGNTFLGWWAGPMANNLTNAPALGANTKVSQSNSLVLGGTDTNAVQVGIGSTAPGASLEVRRGTALDGTAIFWGTTQVSHFSYATDEHTYIRGGKATSYVLLNDNGGNVGVRTGSPNSGLPVASSLSVPFRTVVQAAGAT